MNREMLKKMLEDHTKWLCGIGDNRIDLRNANLTDANLTDANLTDANLRNANLTDADLTRANLRNANLTDANLTRANLTRANLTDADLRNANLTYANLTCADLRDADLTGANLTDAILTGAILTGANLTYANLTCADLTRANLRNANLIGTDLTDAILTGANLDDCIISYPLNCPEIGSFVGWKKAKGLIVKLEICEDALRSSATTRKCRCSKAKVLAIETLDGKSGPSKVASSRDDNFIYRVGEIVEVKDFDTNRWEECSTGIHFFITRDEAVRYC